MKTDLTLKMAVLFLSFTMLSSTFVIAQTGGANFTRDTSTTIDPFIDDNQILLIKVKFKKITEESLTTKVNCGIALSQNVPTAWADYSAYIRFDNADKIPGNIDARNNGYTDPVSKTVTNFQSDDSVFFKISKSYYLWFSIDFANLKYKAYVQEAGISKIYTLGEDMAFRNTTITSLSIISALHNGQSADTIVLEILDSKIVKTIAVQKEVGIHTISSNNFKIEGSNLVADQLRFNQNAIADIFDLTGKLILHSSETSSIDVTCLKSGIYFVKTNKGCAKFIKK
jgi:hypothetical protein